MTRLQIQRVCLLASAATVVMCMVAPAEAQRFPPSVAAEGADAGVPMPEAPDAGAAEGSANDAGIAAPGEAQAPPVQAVPAPVAAGSGAHGLVTDSETGDPMSEVVVTAVGTDRTTRTGEDGGYRLLLAPGTYRLRFAGSLYKMVVADAVEVVDGKFVAVNMRMTLDTTEFQDETVIVTRFDVRSMAAQLQSRREATVVKDSISAEEMSRSPDSNAGDSARRVPGASVVGGKYLVVRGLSGRYTNALLNGVRLPNSDPDEPGVQLDLFPGNMLNSLSVAKTFSPDIPGNFAGGSLQLETRDYPEKPTLTIQLATGANTQSTFRQVLTHKGGDTDFLGLDDGTRALPSGVPNERVLATSRGLSRSDVNEIAKKFPNAWTSERTLGLPDLSGSILAGDTYKVAGRKLGVLANLSYGHQWRRSEGRVARVRIGDNDKLDVVQDLQSEDTSRNVNMGGLGTATYEVSPNDELSVVAMWNHAAENSTRVVEGRSDAEGEDVRGQRFRYLQRDLGVVQILGDHSELPILRAARLKWQVNGSVTGRDEPDTRDLLQQNEGGRLFWRDVPGSGERLYAELSQWDGGGGFDFTLPLGILQTKTGAVLQYTDRSFLARRFGLKFTGSSAEDRFLPPEELFSPGNVGTLTRLDELTRADDSYQADQLLIAGYAMVDVPATSWLRLIGGARVESFGQHVESYSPFPEEREDAVATDRTDTDVLPAASAVLTVGKQMFVRAAYGGTVARPELRELAPFLYQDFVRRRTLQGNPDLLRTYVHNFDLRWEWFPGDAEVVAVSLFYKDFRNPIEEVIRDRQGNATFDNVDGASNFGAEGELRFGLGRVAKVLKPFSFGSNVSVISSDVRLSDEQRGTATSSERPLAGQSPYVANLSLGCALPDIGMTAFVYYNVFGRRIKEVGKLGLPDVYQEPFHSLDVSVAFDLSTHLKLTATASNLLLEKEVLTQGKFQVERRFEGATFGVKMGWSY
jgi:hypothetical protein